MIIRVLTYNIHHAEGTDGRIDSARILDVIGESGADIVGLNEVHHPTQTLMNGQSLLAGISEALNMHYAFGAALPRGGPLAPPFPYGNAVLSRFPLSQVSSFLLPTCSEREVRGLLSADLEIRGATALTCYVTHLENRNGQVRQIQIEALLAIIAQRGDHPHVVVGDYNCEASQGTHSNDSSAVSHMIDKGYADAQARAGNDGIATSPSFDPSSRIDYVWLSPGLGASVVECAPWRSTLSAVASDHFPVLAVLELHG